MLKEITQIPYRDFSMETHRQSLERGKVIKAQMELTYRCNLHCLHCYTDPYNAPEYFPKEMSYAEITRILDEMAAYGILWLNFTGGEVFVRKDFLDIYDYAFQKGFILTLYTNGTAFTESILERLKKRPPFFIDVSCHSLNEEAFDQFTKVKGSLKKFMQGMMMLKASGLPFRLKTKAMIWNQDEIPAIREFYESLGLGFTFSTSLSPRLNGDCSSLDLRLDPDTIQALETREKIWKDSQDECSDAENLPDETPNQLYRCYCAKNHIHVSARAELGTCVFEYEARASLRTHSLAEAIEKVFSRVRSLEYQSDSPCRACKIYHYCTKTPTQLHWETGDPEAANEYHCDVAWNQAKRFLGNEIAHPLTKSKHPSPFAIANEVKQ